MKKMKLKDISKIFTGLRINRYLKKLNIESWEEKPIITQKITNNKLDIEYKKISKIDSQYYSKKKDIIIRLIEPNTPYLIEKDGVIIHSNYAIIRLKEGFDHKYIYYLLKTKDITRQINKKSTGTTLKSIGVNHLKELEFKIPKYKKQRKYGELLKLIEKKSEIEKNSLKLKELYYKNFQNQILEECKCHNIKII